MPLSDPIVYLPQCGWTVNAIVGARTSRAATGFPGSTVAVRVVTPTPPSARWMASRGSSFIPNPLDPSTDWPARVLGKNSRSRIFPIALLEKGDEGVQLNLPMAMLVWGRPVRTQGTQRPANPLIVVQRRWCMAEAIDETV